MSKAGSSHQIPTERAQILYFPVKPLRLLKSPAGRCSNSTQASRGRFSTTLCPARTPVPGSQGLPRRDCGGGSRFLPPPTPGAGGEGQAAGTQRPGPRGRRAGARSQSAGMRPSLPPGLVSFIPLAFARHLVASVLLPSPLFPFPVLPSFLSTAATAPN